MTDDLRMNIGMNLDHIQSELEISHPCDDHILHNNPVWRGRSEPAERHLVIRSDDRLQTGRRIIWPCNTPQSGNISFIGKKSPVCISNQTLYSIFPPKQQPFPCSPVSQQQNVRISPPPPLQFYVCLFTLDPVGPMIQRN